MYYYGQFCEKTRFYKGDERMENAGGDANEEAEALQLVRKMAEG